MIACQLRAHGLAHSHGLVVNHYVYSSVSNILEIIALYKIEHTNLQMAYNNSCKIKMRFILHTSQSLKNKAPSYLPMIHHHLTLKLFWIALKSLHHLIAKYCQNLQQLLLLQQYFHFPRWTDSLSFKTFFSLTAHFPSSSVMVSFSTWHISYPLST